MKKSDPFVVVTGAGAVVLHRSEVVKDTTSPSWKPFNIASPYLAPSTNVDTPLTVEVYDWDPDATHTLIGAATVSLRELLLPSACFPLMNAGKQKPQGEIVLESTRQISS